MNLHNITLTLLFTSNISLREWEKVGNLDAELEFYKRLNENLKKINFVTYGGRFDRSFAQKVKPIHLLPMRWYGPGRKTALRLMIRHFPSLLRTDVFKTNQIKGSDVAVWLKNKLRKKLIVRCGYLHSRYTELNSKDEKLIQGAYDLESKAFKEADIGIVTTERNKQLVIEKHKITPEKIHIIPNSVSTDIFLPISDIHKEFDLVCVADAKPVKNLINLLDGLSLIKGEGQIVRLMLIGECSTDINLREKVQDHKLDVTFKSNLPNYQLPRFLNKAKVFILPSYNEGHSKALIEAMSCGLPCIGTDVEGIRENIRHRQTGYLCTTDPQGIAKAIQTVLADDALQHHIGAKARQYAVNNYSIERTLKMELDILQEIISH